MVEKAHRVSSPRAWWPVLAGMVLWGVAEIAASAPSVPDGFVVTPLVIGLSNPTAMEFSPDGRLFISEQGGALRVVRNGSLLPDPFTSIAVDARGERGLLGIAFDPDFTTNGWVYVYYTATAPAAHNRISRFTAQGDMATAGSEQVILELDNLSGAQNHNGGAIHFGPDGKLYVGVGENANGTNAQSLSNLLGKLLRINRDGSIPSDNPFFASATGVNRAIWALGLRNPFTFDIQPGTGRIFINDVGQSSWEEINEGAAGANYGWPQAEGMSQNAAFANPIYTYPHPDGFAIAGGAFYNPAVQLFPVSYEGRYFFADYVSGWVRSLDPSNANAVAAFGSGFGNVSDLRVGPDGALYVLSRTNAGAVYRIQYGPGQAPVVVQPPSDVQVPDGQAASFQVVVQGTPPFSYQWYRDGQPIPRATAASYVLASVSTADQGAQFSCEVSNDFGASTSAAATLTVIPPNARPVAKILTPAPGSTYAAGDTIAFAGMGTDAEDGTLAAQSLTWRVDFHHDTHLHPFLPSTSGIESGSFQVPTMGETAANVWYRVHLTVTDSLGQTDTTFADIRPRIVAVVLDTQPAGLPLSLDAQPVPTPYLFEGVVGTERVLAVSATQSLRGVQYVFDRWSDGGGPEHTVSTPSRDSVVTAIYRAASLPPPAPDTDGDGVSDPYDTDPDNPAVFPVLPLQVGGLRGRVFFDRGGADRVTLRAVLEAPPSDLSLAGQYVLLDIGGAQLPFVLDDRGRGSSYNGSVAVRLRKPGLPLQIKAKLVRGTWTDDWNDEGVVPAAVNPGQPVPILVRIGLAGRIWQGLFDARYKARGARGTLR